MQLCKNRGSRFSLTPDLHVLQMSYAKLCGAIFQSLSYMLFNKMEALVQDQERQASEEIELEPHSNKKDDTMFDTVVKNYRQWRSYRETVDELNRLSNRDLNDLGISRADITFIARKSTGK